MINLKVNVNDYVKVKLTERGLQILKEQHDDLYESLPVKAKRAWTPPAVDADGYSKFHLHDLMNRFGPCLHIGNGQLPFETEIVFEVEVGGVRFEQKVQA